MHSNIIQNHMGQTEVVSGTERKAERSRPSSSPLALFFGKERDLGRKCGESFDIHLLA
jgi:hypothetical protein